MKPKTFNHYIRKSRMDKALSIKKFAGRFGFGIRFVGFREVIDRQAPRPILAGWQGALVSDLVLSPYTLVLLSRLELALWNSELRSTERVGSE
jgi:hypothetical protein